MSVDEIDPVSGRRTTGHEWNGIKELDTPVPRGVLIFVVVTHAFALLWWFLMPTWPLGTTYTKGLLDTDQRKMIERTLVAADAARAPWSERIETASFVEIKSDPKLMDIVQTSGHRLFGDNCAACHGRDGKGRPSFPNLADKDWIWGGDPDAIVQTITVGINSTHPETRVSQMPAFGRDGILDRSQVRNVAAYVHSLSHPEDGPSQSAGAVSAGKEVFAANCTPCHGENAKGNPEMGAPNLTDATWIYGGDMGTIVATVNGGRQGYMPTWEGRLSAAQIKLVAVYVQSLGEEKP